MSFSRFSIDDVTDCVNETQNQIRDVIATVLSAKYGASWETTCLDEELRVSLQHRLEEERKLFPNQNVSDRLLDYSDIKNLKNIITEDYWEEFSPIFSSKDTTEVFFNELQKMRNPDAHGRTQQLLEHQKHLLLGICGELVLAVERWREGYRHRVAYYGCELKFSVYEEDEHEEKARTDAAQLARKWLEAISTLGKLEERTGSAIGKELLLRLPKGHVKLILGSDYRGYTGSSYFRSAQIHLETSTVDALHQVIETGQHPYWVLSWTLSDRLDVSILVSKVQEKTGLRASSSGSIRIGSGQVTLTNASFNITEFNGARIRVDLDRGSADSSSTIKLVYDGGMNTGFFQAHNVFSVDTILRILYGEIAFVNIQELIRNACTSQVTS